MAAKLGRLPAGITIESAPIENLEGEWLQLSGAPKAKMILYFHGGGYVMGSSMEHRGIAAKFVKGSGLNALTFDYRLAPEHPFPAALDDSVQVYRRLLAQGISSSDIVFAGDSAGGGLCLATLLALREREIPLPAAAVALSPWTDLKCTGESYHRVDPLAPEGSWEVYGGYYAGDEERSNPLISPLYGELHGLPPLFISVGDNENMLDDATAFAEKAKKAGVEVTLQIGAGMVHCYPALSPMFPEAKEAMAAICSFIQSHAGATGQ